MFTPNVRNQYDRKDCLELGQKAEDIFKEGKPKNWVAGGIIIFIWIVVIIYILKLFYFSN